MCSTLGIVRTGRHLILRIRRRVNNNIMHTVIVNDSSNLHHNLAMRGANTPVAIPMNAGALNHVVGILNSTVSRYNRVNTRRRCSVRHRTPDCRRRSGSARLLRANIGMVSLVYPFTGNNGVNLFNNTNMNGAIGVVRLVGGVTLRRSNLSIFTNMNRHAHRNGSFCFRVRRTNIMGVRGPRRSGMTVICNRVGRPPNGHLHITLANLAVTRHFHSRNHSILLFVSGVCHCALTKARMSTLLNHVPSTMNCRPALTRRVNILRRHVASAHDNSVASIRTMCMPTSSLASPSPTAAFTRLSTAIMLGHGVTSVNLCPTVSPLSSASHRLSPLIINRRRCSVTHGMRSALRHCGRLGSVVTVLNVSRLSRTSGRIMSHTHGVRGFLARPCRMTRMFANSPNVCMPLGSALTNFGNLLTNSCSSVPRRTFVCYNGVRSTLRGTGGLWN